MRKYILHFLLLVSPAISFGQDILVKRDSSKIEAKVLEIRSTEIKYKYFNYHDGPIVVAPGNEFAYVIYQNGQSEFFDIAVTDPRHDLDQVMRDQISFNDSSLKKVTRVRDYIKFSVHAGMVINNAYSNLERGHPEESSHSPVAEYSPTGKNNYNCNLNIGFNFLFGKNEYIKHVIGINYLRSKGEFKYNYWQGGYTSYHTDFHYTSKIDFINFTTGLRFTIGKSKHFFIEPLVSFNLIARADVRYSGTQTTTYSAGYPPLYTYAVETEYYNNIKTKSEDKQMVHTISLCPRASYEFKIKQRPVGVYFSYNVSYRFRLPWYMAGITYYPFKKLR